MFLRLMFGCISGGAHKELQIAKMVMTSAAFVTASSQYEHDDFRKYKIDENKIKRITPGLDRKIFTPDINLPRENIFFQ